MAKLNYRNRCGVKDAADCWRTINGHHYVAWMSVPSQQRIDAYRAHGIRCRRFGEELFVHHLDTDEAGKLDQKLEPSL